MSRASRRVLWIFLLGAVAAVSGMGWITMSMLELESAEVEARADAGHERAVWQTLWRMDYWLVPHLAREAGRAYFEYQPYFAEPKAYTRILSEIQEGEVLTPSPLLTSRSELFELHFQIAEGDGLSSPQAPVGNLRDLTEANFPDSVDVANNVVVLATSAPFLRLDEIRRKMRAAEAAMQQEQEQEQTALRGRSNYRTRRQATNTAKSGFETGRRDGIRTGPLLPIWLDSLNGDESRLCFVRRVSGTKESMFQGVVADWDRMRTRLLEQVGAPYDPATASLTRRDHSAAAEEEHMLATVPAMLKLPRPPVAEVVSGGTAAVLSTSWLLLLVAILAAGFALRSTIVLGERRARFASAVTHELRTPLTTFRMYSEMLEDDMVTDQTQRQLYLSTLRREADRLSRLVENVLFYARLDEGRYRSRREHIDVRQLIDRVTPPLRMRADEAGLELRVDAEETEATVHVDVEAVSQILFNLVDNACKYATGTIEFAAEVDGNALQLSVRDHGPGIPSQHQRSIFKPFERAGRLAGDNVTPGIGLGLALARSLAEELGGKLDLDPSIETGARFVLTLPRA